MQTSTTTLEPRVGASLGAPTRPWAPPGASAPTLDEETRAIVAARASLPHDPTGAAALLRDHRARFPAGRLAAERDALLFRVLADLGDRAGARDAGERFLREHPRHPSAGAVRARLEGL